MWGMGEVPRFKISHFCIKRFPACRTWEGRHIRVNTLLGLLFFNSDSTSLKHQPKMDFFNRHQKGVVDFEQKSLLSKFLRAIGTPQH
jgi:hypothetical protein